VIDLGLTCVEKDAKAAALAAADALDKFAPTGENNDPLFEPSEGSVGDDGPGGKDGPGDGPGGKDGPGGGGPGMSVCLSMNFCAREQVSLTGLPNTVQAAKVLAAEAEVLEAEMAAAEAEMAAAAAEMAAVEMAAAAAVAVARKEACRWSIRLRRCYFDDRMQTKCR